MSDTERQRWEEIVERETLGEDVGERDLAFRTEYERAHPECALEVRAWNEMLGGLSEEVDAEGRERMEALASRVLVQRDVERDVVRPLRPAPRRGHPVRNALLATAAAAAVAALVATQAGDESGTRAAGDDAGAMRANAPASPVSPPPAETVPRAPMPDPDPDLGPDQSPDLGRLALAGAGVRIDGGSASAGATVHTDQRIDFDPAAGTDGASACVVQYSPWISTCFSRGSALTFTQSEAGRAVELERGRVVVTLDQLPPGQRFSVVTSKGSVAAIGTAFEVWIDDEGVVRASVLEGKVEVHEGTGTRPLVQGESTHLGSTQVSAFEADALAWSRAHVEATQLWRQPDAGLLVVRPAPQPARGSARPGSVSVDALSVGHAPVSLLAPEGEHVIGQAGSARGVSVEIEAGMVHELELEAGDPATSVRAPGARSRLTAPELARKASEARGAHRYEDTGRILDRLLREYPDSPDAQNGRVQLADLMLDKLGKPAKALRLYDAYLSRGGPLTPEARYGRVRALERLGRSRDERLAIDEFLGKHPHDWRAKQLAERRAALAGAE